MSVELNFTYNGNILKEFLKVSFQGFSPDYNFQTEHLDKSKFSNMKSKSKLILSVQSSLIQSNTFWETMTSCTLFGSLSKLWLSYNVNIWEQNSFSFGVYNPDKPLDKGDTLACISFPNDFHNTIVRSFFVDMSNHFVGNYCSPFPWEEKAREAANSKNLARIKDMNLDRFDVPEYFGHRWWPDTKILYY